MRSTYGPECPVPWAGLRAVRVPYTGFDGRTHRGTLVVAAEHARDVAGVFERIYARHWPIRRITPASAFGGDDDRVMAADNTSGFNCRRVAGTGRWSAHASGAAIDVNPVENPDLHDGTVRPTGGRPFARLDRNVGAAVTPGVLRAGDAVVSAFARIGWEWGGTWSPPDYQHFEVPR